MLVRIAAIVLVMIVVSSAVGGWLYVANNTNDDDRRQPGSEVVSPERKPPNPKTIPKQPGKRTPSTNEIRVVKDKVKKDKQVVQKPHEPVPPKIDKTPKQPHKWTMKDFVGVEFTKGDADAVSRGRHVFSKVQCHLCHDVDGKITKLGPVMSDLAKRFTGEKLIAKILDPSQEINDGYKMHAFVMVDGRVITGIILNDFGDAFDVLSDFRPPGQVTVVVKNEIEEMRMLKISPMPVGLLDRLTKDEIMDLMAFIDSQKLKAKVVVKDDLPVERVIKKSHPKMDMGWGTLSGTIVFDGDPPKPTEVIATKDVAFCGKHKLIDESLEVNPRNGGIRNVVIYLYLRKSDARPMVHPCYADAEKAEVTIDNRGCRFTPHVALLRTTQKLVVLNSDLVGHNAKIDTFVNPPIGPLIPIGKRFERQFGLPERLPSPVSCNIHPWMRCWVLIKDHPYMAVTDENGHFQITNLPPGEWTFQFWHESQGYIQSVTVERESRDWPLGRLKKTITAGMNDLGKIATKIDRE